LDGIPLNLTGIFTVSPGFAFTVSTLIFIAFGSSVGGIVVAGGFVVAGGVVTGCVDGTTLHRVLYPIQEHRSSMLLLIPFNNCEADLNE